MIKYEMNYNASPIMRIKSPAPRTLHAISMS